VASVTVLHERSSTNHHVRLGISYEERAGLPDTMFAKMASPDPEHRAAIGATGRRLAHSFSLAAAQLLDIKESYPTPTYKSPGLLSAIRQDADGSRRKAPEGLAYGTPDQIVAVLRRWEALGVDRVVFIVNALEAVPHQEVLDSLRLFAREVMPAFGVGAAEDDDLVATVA